MAAPGSSSSSAPLLGTAFLLSSQSVTPTQVTPAVCADYAAFRRALDQSRRASDDAITTRLNRAAALAGNAVAGRGAREMGSTECDDVWRQLVSRWTERGDVLRYCDHALAATAAAATATPVGDSAADRDELSALSADWKERGRGLEDERQAQHSRLRTELSVESVIRARSLALFRSRCPTHPMSDPPAPELPRLLGADQEEAERRNRRGRDERGRVRWT